LFAGLHEGTLIRRAMLAAKFLAIFAKLLKLPADLAKAHDLLRGEHLTNRKFFLKPQGRHLSLCGLKISEFRFERGLVSLVGVDSLVQSLHRLAKALMCSIERGSALLIDPANLQCLFAA
jgi:hypothetical protein